MLIIDDILLFPVRGLLRIFREIHHAAQQELADEAEAIATELGELYMMLETGKITEAEFDVREKELFDRLELIQAHGTHMEHEQVKGDTDQDIEG